MTQEIKDAIQESIKTGRFVDLNADIEQVIKVGEEMGYQVEYTETESGWDCWNYTFESDSHIEYWNLSLMLPIK